MSEIKDNFEGNNLQVTPEEEQMAVFCSEMQTSKTIFTQQIKKTLKRRNWDIMYKHYQEQNWKILFQNMIESKVERLCIDKSYSDQGENEHFKILQQIYHVKFVNLKKLFLFGNKITNIEALSWIDCQNLQRLSLIQNSISEIKCMKKISINSLHAIYLNDNPIRNINPLTETKINQKQPLQLLLEHGIINNPKEHIDQNISIVVKLVCLNMSQLSIMSSQRIQQSKIQKMLKCKYSKLRILDKSSLQDF